MEQLQDKPSLQIRLTAYIGAILLISNTLLVLLLLYNFGTALAGFEITIDGKAEQYYFNDHLEEHLLFLGILIAALTTILGTGFTYFVLGKILEPLKALSVHMQKADQENISLETNLTSKNREVASLIASFESMSRKLHRDFLSQKNFSSFVAHELRTPLAVMQARIDLYKKKPENPDELIDQLSCELSSLSTLVTEILDLSGIKRIRLNQIVPIGLLLEEVAEDLEETAQKADVTLLKHTENIDSLTDPRYEVVGNHNLLYRAFYNLVANGIKYNRRGGEVAFYLKETNGLITVEIRDTGYGIPKECRDQIFEPFYRGTQEENRKQQGHGVGLAFAKEVFIHHKGSLKLLDSKDGTTFQVLLLRSEKRREEPSGQEPVTRKKAPDVTKKPEHF